jgi:hypothetical protein
MSNVNLPLSGPVNFAPWIDIGQFTVNVGHSSDANVEKEVIDVASYGKQLGRISEALIVLLRYVPMPPADRLCQEEKQALEELKSMLHDIDKAKKRARAKDGVRASSANHYHLSPILQGTGVTE